MKKRKHFEEGFCPSCGYDFQEGGIVGWEIPELYDGVLFWECQKCNTFHYRFNKQAMTKKEFEEYVKRKKDGQGLRN